MSHPTLCDRCRVQEAEVFLTHRPDDKVRSVALCATCARRDQGLVLGALIQARTPGARPMTDEQQIAVRKAIDRVRREADP